MLDKLDFFFELHLNLYLLSFCFLGAILGSFLNMVIYRLPLCLQAQWEKDCRDYLKLTDSRFPTQTTLPFRGFRSRSLCPKCHHKIPWYHNVPILSFLILKGKCVHCKKYIAIRYFLVEILNTLLFGMSAWHFGVTEEAFFALIFIFGLLAVSFIDIEHGLLPDEITQPLIWIGLFINTFFWSFQEIEHAIVGAMVGYLLLWIVYWIFKLITKKEGMGFGDFKLLALLGAWFGWQMLPQIVLISSLLGSLVGLSQILLKKQDKNQPIPFGPYLAIAGIIALFWGRFLNQWYLDCLFFN